mmetsp:Transcript_27582/g.57591  ORF Transcript_27582/g.57591 Transcript_27582/m.57591 type:complete len:322 (-) Transcript_27582:1055-2020(-)
MVDSLFLSPAFIFAESSFIIVASIAAYELLVGDFVWAQQEEARRASMQGSRGRAGYDSFESRQMQRQLHGDQHRSLSPAGGRGRGGQGSRASGAPSRRASHGEEFSLMYPSVVGRGGGGNNSSNHRETRVSEEAYYSSSSPRDTRFASPGRGSTGDSTRRLFYKTILLALLSRFILIPVETFCFFHVKIISDQSIASSVTIKSTLLRIVLRISQTFPEIAFASALGLLVIFCAQIAFAAMPPLTPESSEVSVHGDDDPETSEDGIAERDSLLGEGSVKGQENIGGEGVVTRWKRRSKMTRTWCTRLSRTVLASKKDVCHME